MKRVLLFASESQFTKEIIYFLIANRFSVHVFTLTPFKSKEEFICTTPLQLTVSIVNLANYYNWKHDVVKYDIVINTLTYEDFKNTTNQNSVFTNFTHYFSDSTKQSGVKVIYLSSTDVSKMVNDAENAMLKVNPDIFYVKYSFIIEYKSSFLHSILASRTLLISKQVLRSKIRITAMNDIEECILSILQGEYRAQKTIIAGEVFAISDIISLTTKYLPKKIIKVPHFLLITISFLLSFLPITFIRCYLKKKCIAKILSTKYEIPSGYIRYQNHTLLSSIVEKHAHNLHMPRIE